MDPEKVKAVQKWPVPISVGVVCSFLGLCSYYQCFVPNFAELAKSLIRLTEKSASFAWGDPEQAAFNALKDKVVKAPSLGTATWKDGYL